MALLSPNWDIKQIRHLSMLPRTLLHHEGFRQTNQILYNVIDRIRWCRYIRRVGWVSFLKRATTIVYFEGSEWVSEINKQKDRRSLQARVSIKL